MDKSDLLEEWDVVSVSSVYGTEKENTESDTKNKETDKEADSNTKIEETEREADSNTKIEETENKNTGNDTKIVKIEKEDSGSDIKTDIGILKNTEDSSVDIDANTTTVSENIEKEDAGEPESKTLYEPEEDIVPEPSIKTDSLGNTDSEPERNILDSECNIEPEFETILTDEPESSTASSEPESIVIASSQCNIRSESDNSVVTEDTDLKTELNSDALTKEKEYVDIKHDTDDGTELNTDDDNIVEDIVHVENPVNNNLNSSLLTSEIESEEFDIQDTPELVPERIQIEQEMAAIESSSSDIDIIDENVEESITSSFISPLSLSISSSVADASSIHSFISPSDDSPSYTPKETIESTSQEKEARKSESTEKRSPQYDAPPSSESRSENVHSRSRESQRTTHRRSFFDWFYVLIELLCSMSGYDWCIIGGVAASLYLTVVMNQTNIFAVVQKDNAVAQMKDMMDELKNDNKMLKEEMLSELKNKKAISSFEHQIRELRKENSKLSHMLYDVAKVLDKQKYSHEKKESEYLAPFKKEINTLKEHINVLKFDNEELQKELVRMRYGSYAQGDSESKDKSGKKGSTQAEDVSAEEIPEDFESLKKWNELITLLTQELSSLSGSEGFKNEKFHSDTKDEKSKPFWKVFTDFKSIKSFTFNDLRKINFTALFSDYKKANQKAMSDVYKFVKDFFSVAERTQQYTSNDDGSQWNNIGDFVSDLKEKWTNIKDRLYASDLRQNIENHFRNAFGDPPMAKRSSQESEGVDSKIPSAHSKSEKKHDQVQTEDETKWMFKRAAHREELRNVPEEEEEVNWYLKKSRQNSDDEKGERHV